MNAQTTRRAESAARVLAMLVAANGRIDERELDALERLDAFRRLGVGRARFIELARDCLASVGTHLAELSWLRSSDLQYLDRLLDDVLDPEQRLLVCRLAAAVITADGRITHDERLVYDHALTRWRVSPSLVTQAIREDRTN